jgi:hypothetical protein
LERLTKYFPRKELRRDLKVLWYYGPTGCGKTRRAYEEAVLGTFWFSSNNLQWFDGYCGQQTAVFDDFRPDHCSFSFLLRLLDIYPLQVPVKHGFTDWVP